MGERWERPGRYFVLATLTLGLAAGACQPARLGPDDEGIDVDAHGKVSREIVCISISGHGKKKNIVWTATSGGTLALKDFTPYDCTICPSYPPPTLPPPPPEGRCQGLIDSIGRKKDQWTLLGGGLNTARYSRCAYKYQACVDGKCGPDPIIMIDP